MTKQKERVESYESCLAEDFQPKTEMTSLEKWAMIEMLSVVDQVHKMAQKGDFRNLGIILIQFYEDVMMRRQWGYNSFISSTYSKSYYDEFDLSALHRYISIFDQFVSLLHLIHPELIRHVRGSATCIFS